MSLYPLFANLEDRSVLVVGGGAVAERKIAGLLRAQARVRVGAPEWTPQIDEWISARRVDPIVGEFSPEWLDGAWLVIAATGDKRINRLVATEAQARQLLVNVVDDVELSSFHVPAVVDRAPLQIAISSAGAAPMLARLVRERLETLLDHALGPMAALFARYRDAIRTRYPDLPVRRRFYERVLAGHVPELLRANRADRAETLLLQEFESNATTDDRGRVTLVGAGPGHPGLLTLDALRALNEADVIVHDRLVSHDILDLARRDAERIDVGKRAGEHSASQERINRLLVLHARAGRRVVRLKGGDSFVFGRGGEELEYLRDHDIPYAVVPGVTAALACAAYAGIPLTHRDHAQSLRLVTAHCKESLDTLDWRALAAERQTLVVYMGLGDLGGLRDRLLQHGRCARTPYALIENGSRPDQRVVTGTLADLPEHAKSLDVRSPALLILGEVAALAPRLAWFGSGVITPNPLAHRPFPSPFQSTEIQPCHFN